MLCVSERCADVRDRTVVYFTKRLTHIRYSELRAAGYPIGSGYRKRQQSRRSATELVTAKSAEGQDRHAGGRRRPSSWMCDRPSCCLSRISPTPRTHSRAR